MNRDIGENPTPKPTSTNCLEIPLTQSFGTDSNHNKKKGRQYKKHETLRNVFSSIRNDLPKTPLVCCRGVCCCGTLTGTAPPESHRSVTLRWCSGQGPVASGVAGGRGGRRLGGIEPTSAATPKLCDLSSESMKVCCTLKQNKNKNKSNHDKDGYGVFCLLI